MNKKQNHKMKNILPICCLVGSLTSGVVPWSVQADTADASLNALIHQAKYWHDKDKDDLATGSLKKVLRADPHNISALYYMALWAHDRGNDTIFDDFKTRLTQVAPNSYQLAQLNKISELKNISQDQLAMAREQAQIGNIRVALTMWRKLFTGNMPPISLAPEYYLTMAGDHDLYPEAVRELRKLRHQAPKDEGLQVTLGQILTYRAATRREGIALLQKWASEDSHASDALRKALLWLAARAGDEKYYLRWMENHPQDSDVIHYFNTKVVSSVKSIGFEQLKEHHYSQARHSFESVLKRNPKDADALAGLGYVALQQQQYADAEHYLQRSAKLGGRLSSMRGRQAREAAFYAKLALAKVAYHQGHIQRALALTKPLMTAPGVQGRAVKLFRADLLRHQGKLSQAETLLHALIQQFPANEDAKEALYYVLMEQNKTQAAGQLLATLPKSVQQNIHEHDQGNGLREKAKQKIADGFLTEGIELLSKGVASYPNNPWLRLDLARIYVKQGAAEQARAVMAPVFHDMTHQTIQGRYVAALFTSDQQNWQQVASILRGIPEAKRTAAMKDLLAQCEFRVRLRKARLYLSEGDKVAAERLLKQLSEERNIAEPNNAGQVANLLMSMNEPDAALRVVHHNLDLGIKGTLGDYTNHISVLYQAGLTDEAQALLNNPKLVNASTKAQQQAARIVFVIAQADALRNQGKFADAYDVLTKMMQEAPDNHDLMFAMARLYESGKMPNDAQQVYEFLILDDTPEQDARVGLIRLALASGQVTKARQLANGFNDLQTPDRLLLLAKLCDAEGNHQQALTYLRAARGKLLGMKKNGRSTSPMIGNKVLSDNPFRKHRMLNEAQSQTNQTHSQHVLPWQVNEVRHGAPGKVNGNERTDLPAPSKGESTLNQVDEMMTDVHQKTATWTVGKASVRQKKGERGLSSLTEARMPLQWSTVPFGQSRMKVNVVPVALNAGSASSDASRRFGTGALIQGQVAAAEVAAGDDVDTLPDVDSQGTQRDSGVELSVSIGDPDYQIDVGTTPLGARLQTLVGGIQWAPALSQYSRLTLAAERRAMKDSLLSYVGVKDNYSGKTWGQVTKNGGSIQFSYDDGLSGFYAKAGVWSYVGKNVASNNSLNMNTGIYFRPAQAYGKELKTGVSLSYENFDHNLSYYSFGQGGYFSPQDYISITFPVDYHQQLDKTDLLIGGSLGYQSYTEDQTAYFPNNSDYQQELEDYVSADEAEEAYYDGTSESGIGYNLHARLDYHMSQDLTLGGSLLYDTYGDYNETTGQVWLKRTF